MPFKLSERNETHKGVSPLLSPSSALHFTIESKESVASRKVLPSLTIQATVNRWKNNIVRPEPLDFLVIEGLLHMRKYN
jgi:hypothetical protein